MHTSFTQVLERGVMESASQSLALSGRGYQQSKQMACRLIPGQALLSSYKTDNLSVFPCYKMVHGRSREDLLKTLKTQGPLLPNSTLPQAKYCCSVCLCMIFFNISDML